MTLEKLTANNTWETSIYPSIKTVKLVCPGMVQKLQKAGDYQYYLNIEYNQLYRQKSKTEKAHLLEVVRNGYWRISELKTWENAVKKCGPDAFKSHGQVQTFEYFTDKKTGMLYRVTLQAKLIEVE